MTTTRVRTEVVTLPGGQVLRASLYADQGAGTVVLSRGWEDGPAVAGIESAAALTFPAAALGPLTEALTKLKGES